MSHILSNTLANVIPFTYLCPWLLSSAFVRFWLFALPSYLFHDFHLLEPPSVEKREGFFFTPKHSHEKFFRKFFQIHPKRLFADFLARICDEGNGCLLPAYGGVPSFCGLVGLSLPFFRFPRSLVGLPCWCWVSLVVGFRSFHPCGVVGLWASCLPASLASSRASLDYRERSGNPWGIGRLWTMGAPQ